MSKMKWTSEAPREPGVYWWRPSPAHPHNIVEVYQLKDLQLHVWGVDLDGGSTMRVGYVITRFPKSQWSDRPVPEPEEEANEE